MPINATVPGSPGWWLNRLLVKLADRRPRFDLLDAYLRNEQGIPIGSDKAVRVAYQRLMSMSRTNYAEIVVEARRRRMQPVGFRTGADGDELGDKEAWRIWQANSLDADAAIVDRNSLGLSAGFVIVGGVDDEIGAPLITPEDPREVVVECDPRRPRKVIAALKAFTDDVAGLERAYLYLPGFVLRATRQPAPGSGFSADTSGWEWDGAPQPLPAPVVPVVPFHPAPGSNPMGVFEPHLSILNRLNYTVLMRLEVMTLQAFRQRGVFGVPSVDAAGNEIDYDDIFGADPGALWILPATAKLWESGVVDLGPIRDSVKDDVRDLSAVTSTPMYLFTPDAASGSAEGASLLREGLTFCVADHLTQASDPWERVMSLAFLFSGDMDRAARGDMEVLWASPERFSLAERYDAAAKAQAAGVPWETVMLDILQFSPQQVERMKAQRAADSLLTSLDTVPPAPVGG